MDGSSSFGSPFLDYLYYSLLLYKLYLTIPRSQAKRGAGPLTRIVTPRGSRTAAARRTPMVILGRGRSGPDAGRGARSLHAASRERQARPGDPRMSRGAGRGVGRYVGAAAPGAWPSLAR